MIGMTEDAQEPANARVAESGAAISGILQRPCLGAWAGNDLSAFIKRFLERDTEVESIEEGRGQIQMANELIVDRAVPTGAVDADPCRIVALVEREVGREPALSRIPRPLHAER